jgi:LysR family transcriptional regulator for bpeEF and oprC
MDSMDQLLALRVFVRIAEAGSFVRAADSLDIPKPTVTKLVQELERHLGVKLLQRTTRKVSVTAEGAAYYDRAVRLVGELDDMDAAVNSAGARPQGRLRVDIGSSLANLLLIPALPAFRRRYPQLQLDLGVSDRPADLVGEGVDCVIRGGALADSSLVARPIAQLGYVTCASPGYLRQHGVPEHPAALEEGGGHAVLSYFSSLTGRPFPLVFERGHERQKKERVEVPGQRHAVAVSESTAHLTALLHGLGIGQTFAFMAAPHIASGALVPVLAGWQRDRHPLHVVYPSSRHLNAKVRVFVDWVAEVFASVD